MRRRRRRLATEEIPQASLPDIAFLLMIFFIAATVFGVEHGLPVVLPSAQRSPRLAVQPSDVFRLEIRADGSVLAERRPLRVEQIGSQLLERQRQRQAQGKAELVVIVETHPDAAYEPLVAVLDQVRFAGCRRVALATMPGK